MLVPQAPLDDAVARYLDREDRSATTDIDRPDVESRSAFVAGTLLRLVPPTCCALVAVMSAFEVGEHAAGSGERWLWAVTTVVVSLLAFIGLCVTLPALMEGRRARSSRVLERCEPSAAIAADEPTAILRPSDDGTATEIQVVLLDGDGGETILEAVDCGADLLTAAEALPEAEDRLDHARERLAATLAEHREWRERAALEATETERATTIARLERRSTVAWLDERI